MRIVLIDDSIAFDGSSPATRPLGGAEKAFVHLATALAKRGHDVVAVNRLETPSTSAGVSWAPFDMPRPPEADVLIAFRKPRLLTEMDNVDKKFLWLTGDAKILNKPVNQARLDKTAPTLVFQSQVHKNTFDPWKYFRTAVVEPGVGPVYLAPMPGENDEAAEAAEDHEKPKKAIVTTHPLHGLSWILDRWDEIIHPRAPKAILEIVSAALYKAGKGGEVPERLAAVYGKAAAMANKNVRFVKPESDPGMAQMYREAAVHLYPAVAGETYCWTLAESQAAGLPAVAMDKGPAQDRVRNGQTGFLVPDESGFANVAVHLLNNPVVQANMARDCRIMQRGRTWDMAAAEFESLWA